MRYRSWLTVVTVIGVFILLLDLILIPHLIPSPRPPVGDANPPATGGSSSPNPTPDQPQVWVNADTSPFSIRGIVEGFYGTPWTQDKRLDALTFMGRVGMNTYVYAPKDDTYERADWRKLYPLADLDHFRALLDQAGKTGINFVYSISPGLNITYSSADDRRALAAKVDQMRVLGIHTFMLAVDDVPEKLSPDDAVVYGQDFARAQADLANWLRYTEEAQDPDFRLWMTPSHYSGTGVDPYLTTLGDRLDPGIQILWTGPQVLSSQITPGDADAFASDVGRRPIIWDNYPVNDYTYVQDNKPRLNLGPLRGRSSDLAGHVAGYLLNPMEQEKASQLPLYTAAAYLADPAAYDPDLAWLDAAKHLANNGDAGAQALIDFASYSQYSMLNHVEAPELAQALSGYWSDGAPAAPATPDADGLRQLFTAMIGLPSRLAAALPTDFYDEVSPWVTSLHDKGEAGLSALQIDLAVGQNDAPQVKAGLDQLQRVQNDVRNEDASAYIGGMYVEDFLAKVIDRARPLAG